MKTLALTLVGMMALAPLAFQPVQAESTSGTQSTQTAKKKVAAKKAPAKKTSHKKAPVHAKKAPVKVHPAVAAAVPAAAAVPLTPAQLTEASKVYTGLIHCTDGGNVTITPDPQHTGYFHVAAEGHNYYMHAVTTRTGAVQVEDPSAGAIWLQLGNKSMLLDQRNATRVADGCESKEQVNFVAHMNEHPAPDLLGLDKK